eukprot:TRINITY_DN3686_c0_g1_i2.p1 TRINITY_DN3686_c0_g1~~TRINITY_DN3686_c0_g1_i2.p1  ORF type:complete len:157 (-),score=36.65 TRINITY_DN3686_c0_g1_i2:105-575(-)
MTKNGPLRVKRNASALEKQFKKICKGLITFTLYYLAVKNMPTTSNISEEDIIRGAIARCCFIDIYEPIRNDREKDKRKGKTNKRKSKLALCKWLACWRVLLTSDKLSGAASLAEAIMDVEDLSDKDGESCNASSPVPATRSYERRPGGNRAAKSVR